MQSLWPLELLSDFNARVDRSCLMIREVNSPAHLLCVRGRSINYGDDECGGGFHGEGELLQYFIGGLGSVPADVVFGLGVRGSGTGGNCSSSSSGDSVRGGESRDEGCRWDECFHWRRRDSRTGY